MDLFSFLFSATAKALGYALLFSIGQSLVIFICLRIVLKFIPNVSSGIKYSLAYCAYLAIGGWFLVTLIRQYSLVQSETIMQTFAGNLAGPAIFNSASDSPSLFSFSFLNGYLPFIVAFYFLGISWYSLRLSVNLFKTRGLKSKGLFDLDPEWQHHITELAGRMHIRCSLQTFFSTRINTPMMIGFFKPVILLPFAAMNQLSAEQFEAILLHELAHIRRNDYLLNIIQSVLDTVLFFNPFTWWITKYIREEREKSCDEMVLQFSDPYHYARALLYLEEPLPHQPLTMTAVGNQSHLFHRIKNIMEMKNNQLNLRHKFITLLVIAIATISVSWLSPEKNNTTHFDKHTVKSGVSTVAEPPAIFTFFNFRSFGDTSIPTLPEPPLAAPNAPSPPVAIASNKAQKLPPSPPLPPLAPLPPVPPLPPVAPVPPVRLHGLNDSLPSPADYFNSKEWRQQQEAIRKSTEEMRKYFQSDAWKKQQDLIRDNATAMKKYFNSPEWKKQQELIKKNAEEMKKYFNSPEWKKQQELIKKNGAEMRKYFNSPEWKKQQELIKKNGEELKKYFDSPEWKKQQEQIRHATDSLSTYFKSDTWQKNIQTAIAQSQKFFQSDDWRQVWQNLRELQRDENQVQKDADKK
jgi:beta-lactamase regulating signal transducer with metallopeptidase domain